MLEICFNNGLKGSLMCAKEKRGSRVLVASVFGWREGENPPAEEEIEAHKRKVQEEHEKAMAEMIPLGGESWQVFAFSLGLSQGDISVVDAEVQWEKLCKHLENGEELRIWYDPRNPEDICGLYWFLWMLKEKKAAPKLWLMPLPGYFTMPDGGIRICRGWGEIEPEKLGHHLHLQCEVSVGFAMMACTTWEKLRKENAPLRAVVNGMICSVTVDFYDGIIGMELEKQPEEFKESNFIGELLCNSCLSAAGDEFIHSRLMAMVASGELMIIVPGESGSYRGQILHKIKK